MRNFRVSVVRRTSLQTLSILDDEKDVVVLGGLQQATGLATMLLNKGSSVSVEPCNDAITHRNTHAALAYLEVKQMELDYTPDPVTERMKLYASYDATQVRK